MIAATTQSSGAHNQEPPHTCTHTHGTIGPGLQVAEATNKEFVKKWIRRGLNELRPPGQKPTQEEVQEIMDSKCQFFHIYPTLFASLLLNPDAWGEDEIELAVSKEFTHGARLFLLNEKLRRAAERAALHDVKAALGKLKTPPATGQALAARKSVAFTETAKQLTKKTVRRLDRSVEK